MRANGERVLLVVDHKNLLYKSAHSHAALFSGRKFTGGLYGFVVSMLSAVRETKATAVAVATDSPPYVRNTFFAGYKGDRAKSKDDEEAQNLIMKVSQSMPMVREFLEAINIPFWEVKGFEFDDICAWAAYRYSHRFTRIVAQTNDSDLCQLFDSISFGMFKGGGAKGVYTRDNYVQEWGDLTRDQFIKALCLTGTHNAVPGIHGVGPVTAKKALKDPVLMRQLVYEHGDMIERNKKLIELPHADFPEEPPLRIKKHRFETRNVLRFLDQYDIQPTRSIVETLQDLKHIDEAD